MRKAYLTMQIQNKNCTLYKGDCLEILPTLKDGSIDLVLTDPPYGTTDCKWDSIIPLEPMWEQLNRVSSDICSFIFFSTQPFSSKLISSNLKMFKYEIIWMKTKPTGFQHAKNMPLRKHENILVFSKGKMGHSNLLNDKRMVYNPQDVRRMKNPIIRGGTRRLGTIIGKRPSHKEFYEAEFSDYPLSVIFSVSEGKVLHPTQKPVFLLSYLVKTFSNKEQTVLDFTMGSGTTGLACKQNKRNFIGIEKEQKYFDIACERLKVFL